MSTRTWIGFDLDGTLASFESWQGPEHIGAPIQPIVDIAKQYLSCGVTVKILTARVCSQASEEERELATNAIKAWCKEHLGQELEVTSEKDFYMTECYDDRAIQVEYNTGRLIMDANFLDDERRNKLGSSK